MKEQTFLNVLLYQFIKNKDGHPSRETGEKIMKRAESLTIVQNK
jgi:hypothetical protein